MQLRVHGVDSLELGGVVVFRGLVGGQDVLFLVDVAEDEVLDDTLAAAVCVVRLRGLTNSTVTIPPTIAGPPKSQTRCGSVMTAERAKLMM